MASSAASPASPIRLRITFSGTVQGVGFRAHVLETVERVSRAHLRSPAPSSATTSPLGVTGWVMNEPDGTVLAEMQGPATLIELVIDSIRSARGRSIYGIDRLPVALIKNEASFVIQR